MSENTSQKSQEPAPRCVDCIFYGKESGRCKNKRMGNQIVTEGCYCAFFDRIPVIIREPRPCPVCGASFVTVEPVFLENGSARAQIRCDECGLIFTRDVWGGEFSLQAHILVSMWNEIIR